MATPVGVWIISRLHRTMVKASGHPLTETICVLSDVHGILPVLNHPFLHDWQWEKISPNRYNAYDDKWEYICEHWQIEDITVYS